MKETIINILNFMLWIPFYMYGTILFGAIHNHFSKKYRQHLQDLADTAQKGTQTQEALDNHTAKIVTPTMIYSIITFIIFFTFNVLTSVWLIKNLYAYYQILKNTVN